MKRINLFFIILIVFCWRVCANEQSFILEPSTKKSCSKQKHSKLAEQLVRGCSHLLKEATGLIEQVCKLNRCAGNCAADILDGGAVAGKNNQEIAQLVEQIDALVKDVTADRERLEKNVAAFEKKIS